MPHAPPPPNNNEEIDPVGVLLLVAIIVPIVAFLWLVVPTLNALLSWENQTDFFLFVWVLFALSYAGLVSETFTVLDGDDAVRFKTFLVVFLALAVTSLVLTFGLPLELEIRSDSDDRFQQIESVGLRVFQCVYVSLLLAGLVFTLNLFQYWFLCIKYRGEADPKGNAMFELGRCETWKHMRLEQLAEEQRSEALSSTEEAPAFDVDWSLFGDDPDALRRAAQGELEAASKTNDPVSAKNRPASTRADSRAFAPDRSKRQADKNRG